MTDSTDRSHKQGLGDRIVRASLAVGVAHLCFKLVGLVQAILVGRFLGDEAFDVIYVFAFEGIIWAVFFRLGEETIGPCFLPVFMEQKDKRGEPAAWTLASIVLSLQLLILIAAVLGIMCFPEQVISLGTYWNRTVDAGKFTLATRSLIWIAPCLIGLSLGSTTYMILNGYKKFFLAAFGEASWKICVLIAIFVGFKLFDIGYMAIIFGLLAGSAAKLLTHLAGLLKQLHYLRPNFNWRHPAVRTLAILMLPMILGTVFSIIRDYYNNVYVLSYIQTDGLMKANSFGRKLYLAIAWMVPYTVGIAMFPFFCELVDQDDKERLGWAIGQSSRMLCAVFIPAALVGAVLSEPLALALFEGGKFTARTATWAAVANACYILVLPAYSLEYIFMQGYFAKRKMWTVILVGMVFSTLSVAISYWGVVSMKFTDEMALVVVALGYTVARTFKVTTLALLLKREIPMLPARETLLFLVRALVVGLLAAAAGYLVSTGFANTVSDSHAKLVLLARLLLAGLAAGGVMLAAAKLCRLQEPFTMIQWSWQQIAARLNK